MGVGVLGSCANAALIVRVRRLLVRRNRVLFQIREQKFHCALQLWVVALAHRFRVAFHLHVGSHPVNSLFPTRCLASRTRGSVRLRQRLHGKS